MDKSNSLVLTIAGDGTKGHLDGEAKVAKFNKPYGIVVDKHNNLIVVDHEGCRIRKIDPTTGIVSTIAGSGLEGYLDGDASNAKFDCPFGISMDKVGNLFIGDYINHRIRKLSLNGKVETFAGDGNQGFNDGIPGTFSGPRGVAVDQEGNVYVADGDNHRIRKVLPNGTVTTLAGDGTRGYTDGLDPKKAKFSVPRGVAVDNKGNVFVADTDNHVIRKIAPSGEVSTVAGDGNEGFVNGNAKSARFSRPFGITVDLYDNIIVADSRNHAIRKITPEGEVSVLAGTGKKGFLDGDSSIALFNCPTGVAADMSGNYLVADDENHRIRKILCVDRDTIVGTITHLLQSSEYADFEITLQEVTFKLHKPILHARCPALLHNPEIDISPNIFTLIVHFIYCNELKTDDMKILFSIASFASEMKFSSLLGLCEYNIVQTLSTENVIDAIIKSATLNLPVITEGAISWWAKKKIEFSAQYVLSLSSHPEIIARLLNSQKGAPKVPSLTLPKFQSVDSYCSQLYNSVDTADTMILLNETEKISFHKCIVGPQWPHILSIPQEHTTKMPIPTFKKLIQFFYDHSLLSEFTLSDCLWITSLSEYYKIQNVYLMRFCSTTVAKQVEKGEWFENLKMALKLDNKILLKKAMNAIPENIDGKHLIKFLLEIYRGNETSIKQLRESINEQQKRIQSIEEMYNKREEDVQKIKTALNIQ
eukprot:TRINITY_DN14109_c0_g1_i1.p1 TRINITY_DN14109_c0_g1~~TRINITY_DN14109_c0_g1_i1.p1  ORF type:complete len:704 (+),score=191.81 TRINITY_DN14109_c0_g1_i1:61-2172(+)